MLKLLFSWFDLHPWIYWVGVALPSVGLIAHVAKSVWAEDGDGRLVYRDRLFIFWSLAFLFAWRWPCLFESREFNPDESQLIAGALTLVHDPIFWRSVDGTTSGPLNFYALLPLHALGLPLDYFTARLTAFLLMSATWVACYRLLRTFAPSSPSQLALLPLLIFFGTTTDPFFLQYSSGDISITLFALSAFWLVRGSNAASGKRWSLLLGGVTAGLLPWAKLQTVPLAAALVGSSLWLLFIGSAESRRRNVRLGAELVFAAMLPSLIGGGLVAAAGEFEAFVQGYFRQNFVYIDGGMSASRALRDMWAFTAQTNAFPAFLGASLSILLICWALQVWVRRRPGRLFIPVAMWVVAAALCVMVPRRPYAHYLLLATVPFALGLGAVLGELWPSIRYRRCLGLLMLALGCGIPLAVRFRLPPPVPFGRFAENWRHPYSLPGTLLRSGSVRGDALAVWGWRTDLYVDANLRQATRDPHTVWSLIDTRYRDYYRSRYLADLQRSRPAFFVDAVGPGAVFYQNRRELAHEVFPALAEYIDRNYFLLADLRSERIYARSDLRDDRRNKFSQAALREIIAQARPDARDEVDAPGPERIEPSSLGIWNLDGRNLRMLLPPAKLTWLLDGTEREAAFSFGFHPRAYLEGTTNGADLIVELEANGAAPRILYQRHLDPAKIRDDRKVLTAHVALPLNVAGMRLVIRTEPGQYGDQAWDWVYMDSLRYVRAWPREFPGFETSSTGDERRE